MKFPFGKAAWREIKIHPGRYLAILAIVALGVGFYAGLFMIEDAMLDTANSYITEYNLYDFSVSSTLGLYKDDVRALSGLKGIRKAEGVITADAICTSGKDDTEQILHFMSITKSVSRPEVIAGRMPKQSDECLADSGRYTAEDIGKTIRLKEADTEMFSHKEYTIVGIGNSVEYISYRRGNTSLGDGSITAFCYIPEEGFAVDYYTAVHLDAKIDAYIYSEEYDRAIEALEDSVNNEIKRLAQERGISYIKQAQDQISDGVAAYEQGQKDLAQARLDAEAEFAKAQAKIDDGYAQLNQGKEELAVLEEKMNLALAKATEEFNASMAEADALIAEADKKINSIDQDHYQAVTKELEQLEQSAAELEVLVQQHPFNLKYIAELARVELRRVQLLSENAEMLATMNICADLLEQAKEIRDTAKETFDKLDLAAKGIITLQRLKLTEAQTELTLAEKQLNVEKIQANREFTKAEQELADALALLKLPEELQELTCPKTYVLTREQNIGYISMETDSTIVSGIAVVFPVFFVLVAALVCSTVMTRMVEDERISLGTLKAMGYSRSSLMAKYLIYAGSASLIGSVCGFFLGTFGLPRVLWMAYTLMYDFTDTLLYVFNPTLLAACVLVSLVCCMGTAAMCVLSCAGQMPAQLMRPRVSASGKRVFFERITFLWKPLPFLSKVALRNIWRYKKRLLVMILGIGGSTALLVTGFGLGDSIKNLASYQYDYIFLYDYKVSFKEAQDEQALADFFERNRDKIGYIMSMHQSEQDVESAHGSRKATLHVSDIAPDGYINFSYDGEYVPFPEAGQAVINGHLAELLQVGVGDTLTVGSDDGDITVTISGIIDNYIDNLVYINTQTYTDATTQAPEIKTALIYAAEGLEIDTTAAALRGDQAVAYLESCAETRNNVQTMMQSMNYVVITVIVCAGALAYIVLFNLTNINITERRREIATLRVIGLYRGETRRYVMTENYVLSVIGALLGMPVGILLHHFVMSKIVLDNIAFPVMIAWQSYLYAFLLTILFAILVGLALRPRIDRIDMAESLKSVE
ncbi:MAG: ABC transporter permease [Clostridia bacterium]|nr:ABC transporter permease [Clostridia bacterium]